jgi:hypothetical protein
LEPDFPHRPQEAQFCGSVACLGEESLLAVGVPGPDFPHRLQRTQFCGAADEETEPAGLCLLLPVEQQELWDLVAQGHWFLWLFRVKVAGLALGRAQSSKFLCVPGSRTYNQVMEPGVMWQLQRQGIGNENTTYQNLGTQQRQC